MQIPYRKPGKYTNLVQDPHITKERAVEIEKKLKRLKDFVRPKLAAEVAQQAEGGDFSENAGYQAAKGRLRTINQKILNYQSQLRRAIIIEPPKKSDTVELGHKVTIKNGPTQKTYTILGSMETNPGLGVISQSSPLGAKLLGRRVGDIVKLKVKDQETEYKIVKIE